MGIVKFKPYSVMPGINSMIEEMFNDNFFKTNERNFGMGLPKVNISESKDSYNLEVQAPGFSKEEIKLAVENDNLIISADHQEENKQTETTYSRREFKKASFKRSFILPETVNTTAIKAKFENGILNVEIPKKTEAIEKPKVNISID